MTRMLAVPALAVVAALALSGCAAPVTPAAPSTPTPAPTPTATPTAEPEASSPLPRFDLDCDAIGAMVDFGTVIDEPVAPRDPIAVYASVGAELPRITYIEAAGGQNCEWSNGVAHASSTNTPQTYKGVEVSILPEADAQWAKYQGYYHDAVGPSRCAFPDTQDCRLDELVGGYWVSAALTGVSDGAGLGDHEISPAAGAFFDALLAAVAALPAPSPRWTPPSTDIALPATCESLLAPAEVGVLLGVSDELVVSGPHGGWSIWAGAQYEVAGEVCGWGTSEDSRLGSITWLRDGAWAADSTLPVTTVPAAPGAVTIAGLAPKDTAFLRCGERGGAYCVVDLVVGGNWVQVQGREVGYNPLGAQETAVAIANEVVARIYG